MTHLIPYLKDAQIVAAVEEGRSIYDNIAKTLEYLLGGNVGERTIMFVVV